MAAWVLLELSRSRHLAELRSIYDIIRANIKYMVHLRNLLKCHWPINRANLPVLGLQWLLILSYYDVLCTQYSFPVHWLLWCNPAKFHDEEAYIKSWNIFPYEEFNHGPAFHYQLPRFTNFTVVAWRSKTSTRSWQSIPGSNPDIHLHVSSNRYKFDHLHICSWKWTHR